MLLSRDGESTWLEGAQLCTLWALVAIVAVFRYWRIITRRAGAIAIASARAMARSEGE